MQLETQGFNRLRLAADMLNRLEGIGVYSLNYERLFKAGKEWYSINHYIQLMQLLQFRSELVSRRQTKTEGRLTFVNGRHTGMKIFGLSTPCVWYTV